MGPIALVDKSFLQMLSSEQLKTFSRHYCILNTPILIGEIIGDLVKSKYSPDQALRRVIDLSTRARNLKSVSALEFRRLCLANMMGQLVPMDGHTLVYGSVVKTQDGSYDFVAAEPQSQKLLRKWASGDFSEEDKMIAGILERELKEYDLLGSQKEMQELFPENRRAKSLDQVYEGIKRIGRNRNPWELIITHAKYCGATEDEIRKIQFRWLRLGKPTFERFAPYAYHCSMIQGIYFVGLTAELVSASKKAKTMIDLIYFYYLPFAQVFISNDKFHRDFFKYASRNTQNFVWGNDLVEDLDRITEFHKTGANEIQSEPEGKNYHGPPPLSESLTWDLWKRHAP